MFFGRFQSPSLWLPRLVSFSRASIHLFLYLHLGSYVLPHFRVEHKIRQCTWHCSVVFTVSRLMVPLSLSIWFRRLTGRREIPDRDPRWCSLRNWEVNWFLYAQCSSCSSEAESMSLCTLLIWPGEDSNVWQTGQMPVLVELPILDTVQLYHTQDLP